MTEVLSQQCNFMPPATRYEPKSFSKKRLFGFHLTDDALDRLIQRMAVAHAAVAAQPTRIDPDSDSETEDSETVQPKTQADEYLAVDLALLHIRQRCRAVWKQGFFLFSPVYSSSGKTQLSAFGFRSVPEPEILERIQRVLAEEGFTEPPAWYNVIG